MFMKFEVLIGTVTVSGTISDKKNEWTVSMTAPGGIVMTDETVEAGPYVLFSEMLRDAVESANRRRGIPERQREVTR